MNDLLLVSLIQLLFPLNVLTEWFFLFKTKRKASGIDINFVNELTLFIAIIWILKDRESFKAYEEEVTYSYPEMTENQQFISNIMWHQLNGSYPFEYLLALLAINTWFKLFLKMRVT